jgi:hypothetical protein
MFLDSSLLGSITYENMPYECHLQNAPYLLVERQYRVNHVRGRFFWVGGDPFLEVRSSSCKYHSAHEQFSVC